MNPYEILGLTDGATPQAIQAAYEERSKRYHPDAGGDAWALRQIQEAYDLLTKQPGVAVTPVDPAPIREASAPDVAPSPTMFGMTQTQALWTVAAVLILPFLVLPTLYYFWRAICAMVALAGVGLAGWLAYSGTTRNGDEAKLNFVGAGASAFFAMFLFYFACASRSYPYVALKELPTTAATIVVECGERGLRKTIASSGSAFVVSSDSEKLTLVTNAHCLCLDELAAVASKQTDQTVNVTSYRITVVFPSGQERTVSRIGESSRPDLIDSAKLEVSAKGLARGTDFIVVPKIPSVIKSLRVAVDDEVRAVGSPYLLDGTSSPGRITRIRHSRTGEPQVTRIQHSAPIDHGSSGGPLFVLRSGKAYCVGVNTQKVGDGQTIGFAHLIDDVLAQEYVWTDSGPAGAVALLTKVHGVAAAVGSQPAEPSKPMAKDATAKGKISERSQSGLPAYRAPSIWPLTSEFPFLRFPQIIFWVLALFVLSRMMRNWSRERAAGSLNNSADSSRPDRNSAHVSCPSCKRAVVIAASNVGASISCTHCKQEFVAKRE